MAQVESEDTGNKEGLVVLHRRVVYRQGSLARVIDYVKGHHPTLGKLNGDGWQKEETIWDHIVIFPLAIFQVVDPEEESPT